MKEAKRQSQTSKIIQYRYDNPHDTLQQIGDAFNVSRQYVFKVLKNYGVPTVRAKKMKNPRHCKICGEISTKLVHDGTCHFQYYNLKINCATCRIPFYRKRSQIKQAYEQGFTYNYCSQSCYRKGKRALSV